MVQAVGRRNIERGREIKRGKKKAIADAHGFGILLEVIAHWGEMNSVVRLNTVFTLMLSGFWCFGLTETNCTWSWGQESKVEQDASLSNYTLPNSKCSV